MRKVILQEFITLDGLAAGPNNSVDFVPNATKGDQSFGREQMKLMDTIDTILLGSVTYGLFVGYWPNVNEGEEKTFADMLNTTPKIVFSKKLKRAPWGKWDEAKVVNHSAVDEVAKLKQQAGKNMVIWGSIAVAQSLMKAKLIDEFRLVVCPVALGNGRALFHEVGKNEMRLVEAKTFDRGAVLLNYAAGKVQSSEKEMSEPIGDRRHVA